MIPSFPFTSSSPSGSALARVDKATSEFLNGPDWRINISICDIINARTWLARDFVKAVKSKLQQKNPNVQLLALTLLETLVKNCGNHVHIQIAERNVLPEMIKIVKRKTHLHVREKILILIDSWQEAFGGRGGRPPQYYLAYEELRRYGVEFPHRSPNAVPIFTPPATQPPPGHPQAGVGSSTRREAIAAGTENLSLSIMESMRNASDVLSDMLQAADPKDRMAVKDEVIVDLVDQCRSNQKQLMQMIASATDEELLRLGLELNDTLQYVVEKHNAIATGSSVPTQGPSSVVRPTCAHRARLEPPGPTEVNSKSLVISSPINEAEDEQDDFGSLASRRSERTIVSQTRPVATTSKNNQTAAMDPPVTMAIVPSDPPPPTNTTTEDMIDFLSLALSPSTSNINQPPPTENQTLNSYIVPWAQPENEPKPQPQVQTTDEPPCYIPPPWAPTPGYYYNPCGTYSASQAASYYSNGAAQAHRAGLKPFIPSYGLFEDLNVLGNLRTNGTPGTSGQSMMSARK